MFLFDGPRLPPVYASVKMNLKLFRKVKRRMLKRLGILGTGQKVCTKILSAAESLRDEKEQAEMRNKNNNRAARAAASEKERLGEIKVKMVMRIYHTSRARALEILNERTVEKAAQEAAKEAEEAAREAERVAAREAFRRRLAERRKLRANCG